MLTVKASLYFYKTYIRPMIEYADVVCSYLPQSQVDRLERFQLKTARIILRLPLYSHVSHSHLLTSLNLPSLSSRRSYHLAILAYRIKKKTAAKHLVKTSFGTCTQPYKLRQAQTSNTPIPSIQLYLESPLFKSTTVFDSVPLSVQSLTSFSKFKCEAFKHILTTNCPCLKYPYYY